MSTPETLIPERLYTYTTDPDSGMTSLAISPDRLIAWSEEEHGHAVERWCEQVCEEKIEAITAWRDDRILELEEQWSSSEQSTDEDEDESEDEQDFHRACEGIVIQAEQRCRYARDRVTDHRAAIEKLVQEARDFKTAHTPPSRQTYYSGYLVLLAMAAALVYVLIN